VTPFLLDCLRENRGLEEFSCDRIAVDRLPDFVRSFAEHPALLSVDFGCTWPNALKILPTSLHAFWRRTIPWSASNFTVICLIANYGTPWLSLVYPAIDTKSSFVDIDPMLFEIQRWHLLSAVSVRRHPCYGCWCGTRVTQLPTALSSVKIRDSPFEREAMIRFCLCL
jgi:hypothetical protein